LQPREEVMRPVAWEALRHWGDDVARIELLAGGVANDVWTVRVNGHLAVGRLGLRSDADLAWETELLQRLDGEGLTVPVPIPTTDGRLFADGVVVMTYVEGRPPETEADWRRVAYTLRQLHRLTRGWARLVGRQTCVVHRDPNPRNIRMTETHDIAAQAWAAWEAAVCWDDEHSVKRLAKVRAVSCSS
jgi:Ser/Thr protein kinase RdoA (MazF antagonist)